VDVNTQLTNRFLVTKDSDEIKAVFMSYQDCLNHGSTEEALALYAPDVSLSLHIHEGEDEVEAAGNTSYPSLRKKHKMSSPNEGSLG
jgi:hypothetical protein